MAVLSIMVELAESLPDVWGELFESDQEAASALTSQRELAAKLGAAVEVALGDSLDLRIPVSDRVGLQIDSGNQVS